MSAETAIRAAAQRLAPEFGASFPVTVEAQLHAPTKPQRFEAATAIALAALLVEIGKAAWDIYRDLKKDAQHPPVPEVIERRTRLAVATAESISASQRDRLIAITVEEITKSGH